jgi:hypothetical protein
VLASPPVPYGRGDIYPLASPSYSLATADFNQDGHLDIAGAVPGDAILIGLNDGTGAFVWSSLAATSPWWVTAADLNGDGIADLAAILYTSPRSLAIFYGRGNGTFSEPIDYPVGSSPWAVAAGDLNSDGLPDLVVSNTDDNTVSVFLNLRTGFGPASVYSAGAGPAQLAIADFDRDGKPDVAVANSGCACLSVFPNTGDGTLDPRLEYLTGALLTSIVAADLDGDGWTDIAGSGCGGAVCVVWNDGQGEFTRLDRYQVRGGPHVCNASIAVGDVDRDGRPDLAAGSYRPDALESWVDLFVQRSDHTFDGSLGYFSAPGSQSDAGTAEPLFVALPDVNDDGCPDILVSQRVGEPRHATGELVVIRHRRGLAFAGMADGALAAGAVNIQAVDFRGSRSHDLLVQRDRDSFLMRSRWDGTLTAPEPFPEGQDALALDLNADGRTDLLTSRPDSLIVRVTSEDGTPGPPTVYIGGSYCALGDFNGDGVPDLLIRLVDDTLGVMLGQAGGHFSEFHRTHVAVPGLDNSLIAAGRLDADAKSDLVITRVCDPAASGFEYGPDSVATFLCQSDGSFAPVGTFPLATCEYDRCYLRLGRIQCHDMNGDGLDDVVGLEAITAGPGRLSILIGQGGGNLGPPQSTWVPQEDPVLLVCDFDGDERPDVATVSHSGSAVGRLWIGINSGDGSFDAGSGHLATANYPRSLAGGDFDGDGHVDLAVGCRGLLAGGSVTVLFNQTVDLPTPALRIALESACYESGRVRLSWYSAGASPGVASLERRTPADPWVTLARLYPDGTRRFQYEDASVRLGARYSYRLALGDGAATRYSEIAEVQTPAGLLGFDAVGPNPTPGDLLARFSLATEDPAVVELLDVSGRRVHVQRVENPAPGSHALVLDRSRRIMPGVYWLRLIQGSRSAVARVVVAR